MIKALLREMEIRRGYLHSFHEQENTTHTLYFGGGTPSVLSAGEIRLLIEKAKEITHQTVFDELTIEVNPDDLTPDYLEQLAGIGINRLSIGIQSFHDIRLQQMRRRHTAQQAIACVKQARQAGFKNITIDLIYGWPQQTITEWQQDVEQSLALEVPHISAYHLSVEPNTILGKKALKGQWFPQAEEKSLEQFHLLRTLTGQAGYEHYEVSNFAREGWQAMHNSAYWRQQPYLGIGPSAHSFDGQSRQWSIAHNIRYIEALENGTPFFEREILTPEMRYNEYLLTSLRTRYGADLIEMEILFGYQQKDYCLRQAQKYIDAGKMQLTGNRLFIPSEHFFISDGIIADLFLLNSF